MGVDCVVWLFGISVSLACICRICMCMVCSYVYVFVYVCVCVCVHVPCTKLTHMTPVMTDYHHVSRVYQHHEHRTVILRVSR